MNELLAALMARVAEFTPEQLESLAALMEHSQENVNSGRVVQTANGPATSFTAGVGTDRGEMLIPTVWNGRIVNPDEAMVLANQKRQDWPLFQDIDRSSRAANLASQLMRYQRPMEK